MATFSREEIQDGLKRLGELAHAQGLHIRLTLVGGAVMVLGYQARRPHNMPFWIYGSRSMDPIEQLAEAAQQK